MPPAATLGDQQPFAFESQVTEQFMGVVVIHQGTDRDFDLQVVAGAARHLAPGAAVTIFSAIAALVTEIDESVEAGLGHQINTAAASAIAAIGAAKRNKFLAAKAHRAVATIAGRHMNAYFINKFHRKTPHPQKRGGVPPGGSLIRLLKRR